ncbi:MAG: hypothetical protein IKG46_13900 [Solobacterium sp.]|nr:hypothetical protein [Solobacterium sp.]
MKFSIVMVCAASLAAVILAWNFTDRIYEKRKSPIPLYLFYFLICAVDTVVLRLFQEKYPADILNAGLLKFSASLPCVTYALHNYLYEKNRFSRLIVIAMFIAMAADIAINSSVAAGAVLFGICHILFVIAFIREKLPVRREVLIWLVLSVTAGILLTLIRDRIGSTMLYLTAVCYIAILISTCVFSFRMPRIIWLSAMVFALSDIMLVGNNAFNESLIMRIAALLVYYVSLLMYGTAIQTTVYPEEYR